MATTYLWVTFDSGRRIIELVYMSASRSNVGLRLVVYGTVVQ